MTSPSRLLLGRFVPVDSPLERLDPRTKLASVALALGALVVCRTPVAFLPVVALLAAAAVASRLPLARFAASAQSLGWLLLITFAFQVVFLPGESEPLARLGPIAVTEEALARGLFLSASLLMTLLFATLLTLSTPPVDLADALAASARPLRRLRVPVDDLALVATIALRFVPTLVDEAERIRRAQIARGLRPGRGPIGRARALLPLLVPLVEGAFRKADDLAIALEARGYEAGVARSSYVELRFRMRDALALSAALLAAAASVAIALGGRGAGGA